MEEKDSYNTLIRPSVRVLLKEKGSKFYGYAFPVNNALEINKFLDALKKDHHSARHWCYAWRLGQGKNINYRANDDGEPNNSAGMPIYGQILSFDVTNVLVVVVRYFGGVKLGVGGLISAYKETAKMALEVSDIEEKLLREEYSLHFDYENLSKVLRILKIENVKILKQELTNSCKIRIAIRKKDVTKVTTIFDDFYEVQIKKGIN